LASSFLIEYFQEFLDQNRQTVDENYPGLNANQLFYAFEDFAHTERVVLDEADFSSKKNILTEKMKQFLDLVREGVPLNYISKQRYFMNLSLYVDPRVLVPRNETEVLVDDLARRVKKHRKKINVCDVGTGSGCIALGILSECQTPVEMLAVDISAEALEVAKLNYFRHKFHFHTESNCEFRLSDRLEKLEKNHFELIVSNPPYIKEVADKNEVHSNVYHHEPHTALFLPDSEYDQWFQDFFHQTYKCLKEGGLFAMECSELHIENLMTTAEEVGFNNVSILKDLTGKNRFLYGRKGEVTWTS
jgi:release factor glutamine methyltransferase